MATYTIVFDLRESPHVEGQTDTGYYPVVANAPVVHSDQLYEQMSHGCTLTPADAKAFLSALRDAMIHHLSMGRRVEIEGLGTFSVTLKSDSPILYSDDKQTARHLSVGSINYRPKRALLNALSDIQFRRARLTNPHAARLTDEQIVHRLRHYLAASRERLLTTTHFVEATGYSRSRAYRELPGLVQRGILIKMGTPHSPYYRLAPDYEADTAASPSPTE